MRKFFRFLTTIIALAWVLFIISAPSMLWLVSSNPWWLSAYAGYIFMAILLLSMRSDEDGYEKELELDEHEEEE